MFGFRRKSESPPALVMPASRIAFCGAPQVGKCTLLERFSKRPGGGKLDVRLLFTHERLVWMNLETSRGTTMLFCTPGSQMELEKTMKWILGEATAVVYVLAPRNSVVDHSQADRFNVCLQTAHSLKKTWMHIPWQFVLNRTDEGDHHPFLDFLPNRLRADLLRTNAYKEIGIDDLFNRLHELV